MNIQPYKPHQARKERMERAENSLTDPLCHARAHEWMEIKDFSKFHWSDIFALVTLAISIPTVAYILIQADKLGL